MTITCIGSTDAEAVKTALDTAYWLDLQAAEDAETEARERDERRGHEDEVI
jgi:hypothetical protein